MSRGRPRKIESVTNEVNMTQETAIFEENTREVDLNRKIIIDALKDLGVDVDEKKTTQQLTENLRDHVLRLNKQVVAKEVNLINVRVKSLRSITNLRDEEFLARLVSLGVQDLYLIEHNRSGTPFFLFRDEDKTLTDKQIWEKIRFSHINPVDTASLFTKKIKRPPEYHFGSKYRPGR